jgi:NO-binding membrane sensor protein with MHYT domain
MELQIAYSSGFTALSFFVPILVLLAAFVAIGTSSRVHWWRVATGGTLAGGAICGMHYLGNASISNYECIYNYVNVAFSAVIAVAASITALALFFVFRASWTHSWWKRGASAILLAGAVSGMHWCASTGTQYRLVDLNNGVNETSRNTTVIIVICLSVGAILVIAVSVFYTARVMSRYASKAQQVVLAAAIFDKDGRVLVSPEGLLPSEKITDSFLEKVRTQHYLHTPLYEEATTDLNVRTITTSSA